jgi:hemoglobin-like flavoprotein
MTGTDCGLFTHKSVPVIFESPCTYIHIFYKMVLVHRPRLKLKYFNKET